MNSPSNTSPSFSAPPIPYVCVGQSVCYNLGVVEPDGDSLAYSLVEALSGAGTPITYSGGFTGAQPITGITIDPQTGQLDFIPNTAGNYIVVVQVEEWDANGNLVGVVVQDIQIEVINCSNQVIDCATSGVIGNITGAVFQTGPTSLEMCEGVPFSFDLTFSDPDPQDSLFIQTNLLSQLPGATLTTSGANPITATISWAPPGGSANLNNSFTITVLDNACPVSGSQTIVYTMDVLGGTTIGPDPTICGSQTAQLVAQGGSIFNWTVISGDPIIVGTNFSCNPCDNPVASPSLTTTYKVTSDLSGSCVNIDTVTVNVVPDFTYTLTQSSMNSCLLDPIQLEAILTPSSGFSYQWSNGMNMDSDTIPNPLVTETAPGPYTYELTMISPEGCIKKDTLSLTIAASYQPDITVTSSDDTLDCNEIAGMNIDLGGGIPAFCGTTAVGCTGTTSILSANSSSGSNGSFDWPAPYGNYYRNAKHQFLYTAAELNAMGFVGGKISEIGWEITNMFSSTTVYKQYTIKMGCTSTSDLTTWEQGLTTVLNPVDVNVALGWNMHVLDLVYEWDGISNLVVEICYDNLADPYTDNCETPYSTTAFNSCIYFNSDSQNACQATTYGWNSPMTNRPITKFETCPSIPDPNNYTYDWTPAGVFDDATTQNPNATPVEPGWLNVTVTDINGGCTDQDSVYIVAFANDTPYVVSTDISCFGYTDGLINSVIFGQSNNYNVTYTNAVGDTLQVDNVISGQSSTIFNLIAGTYNVNTSDVGGCSYDTTITILEPTDFVITTISDTSVYAEESVNLFATGGTTYNWSPSTGLSCNNCPNPDAHPLNTTTYLVEVIDTNGCSKLQEITVEVLYKDLFIPNGFSPNGDGLNDILYIRGAGITDMNFNIYDRWGKLVFQSKDKDIGWDGTFNEKEMNSGVYIFNFDAILGNGEIIKRRGNITLFR